MTNITVAGLPAKTGTIEDGAYWHLTESGVDKKATIAQLKAKLSSQYSSDINSFLSSANKAEGRANLSIDRRVAVDNADYTILATDKVVAQIGTMSALRTFSLPPANTMNAGAEIIVIDESGSVNGTNKITVQRNGTDTIDGATSIDINTTYGALKLICDGTNSWKVVINTSGVDTQITSAVPVGTITAIASLIIPTGYLECNGATISRTTYANLFSIIGTGYGAGDGSTTFQVPDLRGEFIRGLDNGRGIDSGRSIGTVQGDSVNNFSATINGTVTSWNNGVSPPSGSTGRIMGVNDQTVGTSNVTTTSYNFATGGSETRPRNVAFPYIIKY